MNGPQVEIEASGANGAEAGYIYGEATGRGWLTPEDKLIPHKHFKDGEWNHYRVVAKGPNIQTWINGQPVADLTDEADLQDPPERVHRPAGPRHWPQRRPLRSAMAESADSGVKGMPDRRVDASCIQVFGHLGVRISSRRASWRMPNRDHAKTTTPSGEIPMHTNSQIS